MIKLEDVDFELAPPNEIGLIEIYEQFLDLQSNKEYDWAVSANKELALMPSSDWYSSLDNLISKYGFEKYREHLIYTLDRIIRLQNGCNKLIRLQSLDEKKGVRKMFSEYLTPKGFSTEPPNHYYFYCSDKSRYLKGLIHSVVSIPDPIILKLLEKFALTVPFQVGTYFQAPTGLYTYDILEVFSKLEYPKSIQYIMNLKARIKQTWAQKRFDKHLLLIAKKQKIEIKKVIEIGISDYGFNNQNVYEKDFEPDYKVRMSFKESNNKNVVWINTKTNKEQKSIPQEIKENNSEKLKYLKNHIKDIETQLITQSKRIEGNFLTDNSWDIIYWKERYLNHPFINILTRELIWIFSNDKSSVVGYIENGKLKSNKVDLIDLGSYKEVKLWHPKHSIKIDFDFENQQPFKQIEREHYSSDFIKKIKGSEMKKSILSQLCKSRNWTSSQIHKLKIDKEKIIVQLVLDDIDDESYGMTGGSENVILKDIEIKVSEKVVSPDQINEVILSEVLRDVDLFINVAKLK